MKINISDQIGLSEGKVLELVVNLIKNRKPKEGSFDYGLESHGIDFFEETIKVDEPLIVYQYNKRKSNKSPINITIKKHTFL